MPTGRDAPAAPPAPLFVECDPDGCPIRLRRGGRTRRIAHIAATWVQPALWWVVPAGGEGDDTLADRHYARLVCEDPPQVLEVFRANGRWFLERIVD